MNNTIETRRSVTVCFGADMLKSFDVTLEVSYLRNFKRKQGCVRRYLATVTAENKEAALKQAALIDLGVNLPAPRIVSISEGKGVELRRI